MHPLAQAIPARLKVMAGTMRRHATIGKPKSKKASGASAGTSGTVSRQAQATIDKTMGKTAAYQKQEKQKKQKKQTAREFMEEEKKEKNDADFVIVVYGVTSVLLLFLHL
ncbi:MAG: hypothetical protein ACLTSZ_04630 [Lachnospiraceae bacterium]